MVPPKILFHLYKYLFFVCDCIDLMAHIWGFIMQLQMFFPPYHIYVTWLFIMCVFMIIFVCIFLKTQMIICLHFYHQRINSFIFFHPLPPLTKHCCMLLSADLGIDKSIFSKPKTFHLTVLMLKLWNKDRVSAAAEVLQVTTLY